VASTVTRRPRARRVRVPRGAGGELRSITFHQQGSHISYAGPWGTVDFEFFPDGYPGSWIWSHARLRGHRATFEGDLELLLLMRQPGYVRAPRDPMSRETIASIVGGWAAALRAASDLF
jgi:hypothetical protein